MKRDKSGGLHPAVTADNEQKVKTLLGSLENHISKPESWLYGAKATALDAHLVVFIARLTDVGREHLIPRKLQDYGAWAMQKPEWIEMMGGRKTMVPT